MIDISDFEVVDFHAHPFGKEYLSEISKSDALRHDNSIETEQRMPHWRSLANYLASVFQCRPTMKEVDEILARKYDEDFCEYITSILDREKISKVQIVSETDGPEGVGEFPKGRYVWAMNTDGMMDPDWAREKGATEIGGVLTAIDNQLSAAIRNGCSSLKNIFCGNRSLGIDTKVTEDDANRAYQRLLRAKPARKAAFKKYTALSNETKPAYFGFVKPPIYEDPTDIKSLEVHQDFLLKYLTIRAGELKLPYAFHTGGGQATLYDLRNVNPICLLPLLYDHDVNSARTKIVVLHGGVPFVDVVAAFVSQFSNVYVDTSWPCQTTITRNILKSNLEVNSPTKILHGTDSILIPELLAHGAWNARRQLTEILNVLNQSGWSEGECIEIAELILSKNAKELLKIS